MAPVHASSLATIIAIALPALAGCADEPSEFDTQFAAAERLRLEAAGARYEWLETAQLLEQARTEADAGNLDEAFALVDKARLQAEAAIMQAENEGEAWRSRVLR